MARKKTSIDYDDSWIAGHYWDATTTNALADAYNRVHGTAIRPTTFQKHCYIKLGLRRRVCDNAPFTQEEDEFLRRYYPGMTETELEDAYIVRFGCARDRQAIRLRCWYLGIKKEREAGIRSRRDATKSEIGAEFESNGYLFVKVAHDGTAQEKWKLKQRAVWESAHGEIPEEHIILFLDGNTKNCNLDNLVCVPKSYNGYINGNFLRRSEHPGVTKAQVSWCRLKETLKEMEEAYK